MGFILLTSERGISEMSAQGGMQVSYDKEEYFSSSFSFSSDPLPASSTSPFASDLLFS